MSQKFVVTKRDVVAGRRVVEELGTVWGTSVQMTSMGADIGAWFKDAAGGRANGLADTVDAAVADAHQRLMNDAKGAGADAVICLSAIDTRIHFKEKEGFAAAVTLYGTAVKTVPEGA